jgi:hypothetical protein
MPTNRNDIYEENEEIELLIDFGKEGTSSFLKAGTKLLFVKSFDGGSIDSSKVLAKLPNSKKSIIIKETDVKPVNSKTSKKAFTELNKMMMAANPELRKFHPNFFVRCYYRVYYFFKGLLKRG